MLAAGRLVGRCAASPTAVEVCSDVASAYCAHAGAEFPAYGCIPMPDTINLQHLGLPTMFCFLLGCCSLENHKGQQFGPCLRLSQR